ncbi:hypothetical protein OG361_00840 [Streptomyces sp. NBC_00090]|uniref:hypothetical protein n=1 Tax=Streptomyces sp. NBC_00090 TaxID=2903619 RepID=UPI0032558D0D
MGERRADLPAAHFGLGIVIVASVAVGLFAGPATGALVAGAFAALFLVSLCARAARGAPVDVPVPARRALRM